MFQKTNVSGDSKDIYDSNYSYDSNDSDDSNDSYDSTTAKTISAELIELNLIVQLYSPISVLATFQFWRHFSFGEFSVLGTFQFWWYFSFVGISVLGTFQF